MWFIVTIFNPVLHSLWLVYPLSHFCFLQLCVTICDLPIFVILFRLKRKYAAYGAGITSFQPARVLGALTATERYISLMQLFSQFTPNDMARTIEPLDLCIKTLKRYEHESCQIKCNKNLGNHVQEFMKSMHASDSLLSHNFCWCYQIQTWTIYSFVLSSAMI